MTAQTALLASLSAEIARRQAADEIYRTQNLAKACENQLAGDVPEEARQREQRVFDSDIAQLRAVIAALEAQRVQKNAEEARVSGTIEAQEQFVLTLKERVDMRETLVARAAGARANVIDALEKLNEQQTQLGDPARPAEEVQASLVVLARKSTRISRMRKQTIINVSCRRSASAMRSSNASPRRNVRSVKNTYLRAPNAGIVQALSVINVGQVVAAGEQIMRVVPDGLGLEIEGYVSNKDIGFIKEGQDATIKVESFPFTKWGTVEAKVVKIARDAIPLPEASLQEGNPAQAQRATGTGGAQRVQNLVYQVTLKPLQDKIGPENDRIQLLPGMAVTIEVKTGSRRIISFSSRHSWKSAQQPCANADLSVCRAPRNTQTNPITRT